MMNRIKAPAVALMAVFALSGCDLLDVDNPNSLVEESIRQLAAANGVANGSLQLVSEAISDVWEGPAVTGDELYWIGSRDAWGQLDQGFISNPENEFTDAAFPTLGRAVWMAQNAVEILEGHVAENPGNAALEKDQARAWMFRGMILMVVAESQADMTFSYKMNDGPPVSSGNATIGSEGQHPVPTMTAVMDLAITSLTAAHGVFVAQGEDDLATNARALRARAYHSRVIMGARGTAGATLAFPDAAADAAAVIADVGNGSDWTFNLSYSSASNSCFMCGNVNDRKENQIDLSLVTVDASNDIDGINLQDPIDNVDDPSLVRALNQWKGGSYLDSGNQFPDLTVVNERLLHMILAEDAHATSGGGAGSDFETHINHVRTMDGSTAFVSDGVVANDFAMMQHMRRVNTVLMGLRLQDMYRWDLEPETATGSAPTAVWAPASDAVQRRGSMLPITIIEVRANCHLNGQGCGG